MLAVGPSAQLVALGRPVVGHVEALVASLVEQAVAQHHFDPSVLLRDGDTLRAVQAIPDYGEVRVVTHGGKVTFV